MLDVVTALLMQQSLVAGDRLGRAFFDDAAAGRETWADLTNMSQAAVLKRWHKVAANCRHNHQ